MLLILAGVTIVMLFGESGIITKAQKAAKETNDSVNKDLTDISDLEEKMEEALGKVPQTTKGKLVDKNIKYAKYTDSTSKVSVPIPGGYGVVQDSTTDTDNDRKVNTIANGLVISDVEEDDLDNTKKGNQFVWVPVPDITSMYDEEHKAGKLYDYGTYDSFTEEWMAFASPTPIDYPTTQNSSYREPDIVIGSSGVFGDKSLTNLNIITDFTVEAGKEKTATLFKTYLQDEFDSMIESVKEYKGFYIGRYETGNLSQTKAVVQKGNDDISNVTWYNQYQKIKNMEVGNSNVTISMIWGCQWDRTLNWLIETPNNGITINEIVNSTTWGNYDNNIEIGHGSKQSSGYNKAWQKNHIYDMAGNVYECTMEAYGPNSRVIRGGDINSSGYTVPSSHRSGNFPATTGSNVGSRSTLYITK